jgi:hypothetical protein
VRAIDGRQPDYESAQVYALLSLNETLEKVADQLAELNASIRRPEQ